MGSSNYYPDFVRITCQGIPKKNPHSKWSGGEYCTMERYRAGSDASAAGGRVSELSEWQRSIADEGFLKAEEDIGHRNRMDSNDYHPSLARIN